VLRLLHERSLQQMPRSGWATDGHPNDGRGGPKGSILSVASTM
jgi:hypothetical protein